LCRQAEKYGWQIAVYFAFYSGMIGIIFPYSENASCWGEPNKSMLRAAYLPELVSKAFI
jgi:hypothetical protein